MKFTNLVRLHWAALRALLVFTAVLGVGYPVFIWLVAQLPGLRDHAHGSIVRADDKPVASWLIGQSFTNAAGRPLPQYFQSRPSAADYDPIATGGSNLGPESVVDTPADPAKLAAGVDPAGAGFRASLLTEVCSRSVAVGRLEAVDGSRPFCTGDGVGAVLSVIGGRDRRGDVARPTRVVSVNQPCATTIRPFLDGYAGVRVECARFGEDYSIGRIVPIRGSAPSNPQVPADAVTASGSGLDPDISPAYAEIQIARVARIRHLTGEQVRDLVRNNQSGRELGFLGEPRVNVMALNLELDQQYPLTG